MNLDDLRPYAVPAVIVDVRSRQEFASGSSSGSVNIPLQELPGKSLDWDRARPIIVCCASGTRSAAAVGILKGKGFKKVVNAGPWTNTVLESRP